MYSAAAISDIFKICEKYGFVPPIAEQCEYNLLSRKRVEVDLVPLFDQYGFGLTAALPLYGGMLSGKYNDGVPSDSRFGKNGWGLETSKELLQGLGSIAKELECTQAQLAIAWILKSKDVSNVLLGANTVSQILENIEAVDVVTRITPDVLERIEKIIQNRPTPPLDFRTFTPRNPRR